MLMENFGIYEDQSMEALKAKSVAPASYFAGYPDSFLQIKQEQSGEAPDFQNYNFMAHMPPAFPPFAAFTQPMMHPATPTPFRIFANQPPTTEQDQYSGLFELYSKTMKGVAGTEGYQNFSSAQSVPSSYQNPGLGVMAHTYANMTNPDLVPAMKNPLAHLQMIEANSTASSPYSSREDLRTAASTSHLTTGSPAGSEMDVYGTAVMHDALAEVPDMMNQERIKSERKKARNRIAAKKCRNNRLAREADLEHTVRKMMEQQSYLQEERSKLQESVNELKLQVLHHLQNGCQIDVPSDIDLSAAERVNASSRSPLQTAIKA